MGWKEKLVVIVKKINIRKIKMDDDKLYESVGNYTKYKLVSMIIDKYKDKKMDNLNQIEQLADDVMNVLSVCGLKYYQELKGNFKDETN